MFQISYKSKSIIAISDTHGKHRKLNIPACTILVHCGDACNDGNESELEDFFAWFAQQKSTFKIFVAGNHDLMFDLEPEMAMKMAPSNVLYLDNKKVVLFGVSFYSVPARPWLHSSPTIQHDVDFLLTHGPAHSVLDFNIGCKTMQLFVEKQKPVYHLFGHIHQTQGFTFNNRNTQFVNIGTFSPQY